MTRQSSSVYDTMCQYLGNPGTPKSHLTREQIAAREREQFQISPIGTAQSDSMPNNTESGESRRQPNITRAPAEPRVEPKDSPNELCPDFSRTGQRVEVSSPEDLKAIPSVRSLSSTKYNQ